MKSIRKIIGGLFVLIGFIAALNFLHAQEETAAQTDQEVLLQAVEMTTPMPAEDATNGSTFYSAQHAPGSAEPWAPAPANVNNLPVWDMGGGVYLLDDRDVDYNPPAVEQSESFGSPMLMSMDSEESMEPALLHSNELWLEITNVADGLAGFNLHNATNQVYEIATKTNLLDTGWNIETEVWPTDTNATPFALPTMDRPTLFARAMDWTGVTSLGNTTPEWWFYKFFHRIDLSDTNLDSQGGTLLYDYQHGYDPNIISFSISVTNNLVSTSLVPMSLNVSGGVPSYISIADTTNFTGGTTWHPYASSNIVVYLSLTEGKHDIWIGLKGLPSDAAQTWHETVITLDTTPPTFTVTNPVIASGAATTVSVPMIQVQGLANENLASLTYDVSNAVGIVTNQTGYTSELYYDTNLMMFTTNSFQLYDVPLTNGVNTISIHATDLAGNVTTTNFNVTLDYSGDTNAPVLNLVWPQDGTLISGTNFTLQAQSDDNTATVVASINGETNVGTVYRSGNVLVENLPLASGTNALSLTATDAAGNVSTTNISVIQSIVTLTVNPVSDDQLNQGSVSVTGTVGGTNEDVWVNGVLATIGTNGTWIATGVPVNPTGTADLNVRAYPAGGNPATTPPDGGQQSNQAQPAQVQLSAYVAMDSDWQNEHFTDLYNVNQTGQNIYQDCWRHNQSGSSTGWSRNQGGARQYNHEYPGSFCSSGYGGGSSFQALPPDSPPTGSWETYSYAGSGAYWDGEPWTSSSSATSKVQLDTGDGQAGRTALYLVMAQVFDEDSDEQLAGNDVKIQGQTLTDVTNFDGEIWSQTFVSAPAGVNPEVTPIAQGNIFFGGMRVAKTKEAWQQDVRNEIYSDTRGMADMNNYNPANGFMANRKNLQAVYAFYQKLFAENGNLLWAGLGKLAGAPVYAGLSDAQQPTVTQLYLFGLAGIGTNELITFQNTLITMNTNILQDLAWQSEAYYKGGINALNVIYAGETNALDSATIAAWREIDDGISNNIASEIQNGNLQLAHREQLTVLQGNYDTLNAMIGINILMSVQANNPVPAGTNFSTVVPGGNICVFNDRWNWITNNIWPSWTAASPTDRSTWVNIPLTTRAANYAQNLPVIQ